MSRNPENIDIEIDKLTIEGNPAVIQGLIREPLDVDFFVDPKPLTEKEKKLISDFIKADKEKRKRKKEKKKVCTHINRNLSGLQCPSQEARSLYRDNC